MEATAQVSSSLLIETHKSVKKSFKEGAVRPAAVMKATEMNDYDICDLCNCKLTDKEFLNASAHNCSSCNKKYHTNCLKLPDKQCNKGYVELNWRCPECIRCTNCLSSSQNSKNIVIC